MTEKKIQIPDMVDVVVKGLHVTVKGPKGSLEYDFTNPKYIKSVFIEKNGTEISVKENRERRKTLAVVGTIIAQIRNMMLGVTKGYKYDMKIVYTHFPVTVAVKDKEVQIKNFLGEKGTRTAKIVGDTAVKIEKDTVTMTGICLGDVSQTAANIEIACKLKKRDRRIFIDGVYMSSKHLQTGEAI